MHKLTFLHVGSTSVATANALHSVVLFVFILQFDDSNFTFDLFVGALVLWPRVVASGVISWSKHCMWSGELGHYASATAICRRETV